MKNSLFVVYDISFCGNIKNFIEIVLPSPSSEFIVSLVENEKGNFIIFLNKEHNDIIFTNKNRPILLKNPSYCSLKDVSIVEENNSDDFVIDADISSWSSDSFEEFLWNYFKEVEKEVDWIKGYYTILKEFFRL